MLGHGSSQLAPALVRCISTSTCANAAAPALAPAKSGGLLSSLFGMGGNRIEVPLSERLPAVTEPPRSSALATKPALQTSSLASGVKVATIDTISPVSSLAIFVEGGSSAETPSTTGVSKLLETVAFQATANRSTFRLTRELEKIGATSYCRAGRNHIAFGVDAVRLNTREALEILADSVVNARYTYWEVRDALDTVKELLAAKLKNPAVTVTEVLHHAAFDGGLAKPLVVDPSLIDSLNNDSVKEYIASIMTPSRIVLAGAGVDHAELTQLATPLLAVPAGSGSTAPAASSYVGGSLNVIAPTAGATYVGLAFEAKGGAGDAKSAAAAAVVKALLDSARPTLPYSRKDSDVYASVTPFAHLYKGTGLVGVMASGSSAGALVDGLSAKVTALAKGVSEPALAHAKSLALGEAKAAAATSAGLAAAVGSSILATGRYSASEAAEAIAGLKAAEVSAYIGAMLKSSPTLVAYGNLGSLPRAEAIAKRFA